VRGKEANVAALLADATARISDALGLERREARLEARVLAAHAWQVAPAWLIAHDTDPLTGDQITCFQTLLQRRLAGEPIAYITGQREFYGRAFRVTPEVLIPRPETELLVELALARIPPGQAPAVLDLGTGSGCIAVTLALERPNARITAIDRSQTALAVARLNAGFFNARVEFLASDWFAALGRRKFDLIVSNPPYVAAFDPHLGRGDVRFEPLAALASAMDGLDDVQRIIRSARSHLRPAGGLLLEHAYNQGDATRVMLRAAGFTSPHTWRDLAEIDRVSGGWVLDPVSE
jgi:release factor glutamine methyltransferase